LDAEQLASTGEDKSLRFWDARAAKQVSSVALRGEGLNLAWSNAGDLLAVGCKGEGADVVHIIDIRTQKLLKLLKFHYLVNEMAFSLDDKRLFLTNATGEIEVRGQDFRLLRTVPAHPGSTFSLAMNPKGGNFVVGGADSLISLWDATELFCLRTFQHMTSLVRSVSISFDGQLIASGSEDFLIDISSLDGENVVTLKTDGPCNELAWHPRRSLLAFCIEDQKRDAAPVRVFGFDSK